MAAHQVHARLHVPALGWAFSAALVVLFIITMLAALTLPMRPAHGVMTTVFDAPIDSTQIWVNGIVWAVVAGWLLAIVTGTVYNVIVARQVTHTA